MAKVQDPREEIAKVRAELAGLQAEADRLLDIATPANRDFVDERLGKVRMQRLALESRLADLQRIDYQPVDLEAATADALAYRRGWESNPHGPKARGMLGRARVSGDRR